jgi:O-antigen/teichoic acid export membrane protein
MGDAEARGKPEEVVIIAKGAGLVLIGAIFGTGLRFLFRAIIGRHLGPSLLGIFFIGLGVFRISERIACLGIQNGLLRYIPMYLGEKDEERIKGIIVSGLKIVGVAGIFVAGLIFFNSSFMARNIFHNLELTNVLKAFSLAIPFSAITAVLLFSTQAFRVLKYKVVVREFQEPFLGILIFSLLYLIGWELNGALLAVFLSIVAGTLLAAVFLKKVFPPIADKKIGSRFETKKLIHFSWPLFFVGFFYMIILWINTLLIGYFLTTKEVGFFGAAHNIAMLGLVVVNAFVSIFAPIVSDLSNRGENEKLEGLYKIITKWIFTLSLPGFILMIYFDQEILTLTFGRSFVQGAFVLVILSIAMLVNSIIGSAGFLTAMSGRPKLELANLCITFSVNAVLSILLIPKYGIQGAAYATLTAFILLNVMRLIEVRILFHIHPFRIDLFKPLISGGLAFLALYFAMKYLPFSLSTWLYLAQGVLVFICVYVVMILVLGLAMEDKMVFAKIKEKIKFG